MKRPLFGILMVLVACSGQDESPGGAGDAGLSGDGYRPGDLLGDSQGDAPSHAGDDSGGDSVAGDASSGDSFDPCATVGCGAPPVCGEACDAPCGCCACGTGEGWCAFEETDAVAYACNGACYAPTACDAGLACNDLDGTPACEAGYTVGGTITGSMGLVTLGLYRNFADGQEQTFDGDGAFEFTIPLADGEDYVLALNGLPIDQVCRFSRTVPESCSTDSPTLQTCGIIEGGDVIDITVTCYDENPCEASPFFLCVPSSANCPTLYACEANLSCAADGSPTPDQTCCELCE